jgi:hypothetical protein
MRTTLFHARRSPYCLFVLALLSLAMAPARAAELAGQVTMVTGEVSIQTAGAGKPAGVGDALHAGDSIISGADGELQADLEDGGMIAVRPNSVFRIDGYRANGDDEDSSVFSLLKGAVRSVTGFIGKVAPENYRINTPTATIGVRGTDHEVVVIDDASASGDDVPGTHDRVYEGRTILEADGRQLEIAAGQAGFFRKGPGARPALHAGIPAFLERRRSRQDAALEGRNREIGKVIETRLRQRGKLQDGESLQDFVRRKRADAGGGTNARDRAHDRQKKRQELRRRHREQQ